MTEENTAELQYEEEKKEPAKASERLTDRKITIINEDGIVAD